MGIPLVFRPRPFFEEGAPEDDFDVPEDKFVNFVDRTLILYKGSKVRKFDIVFFEYRASFASYVDSLIRFVVRKNVEELDLELNWTEDGDSHELPRDLYSNASLTKLRLGYCHFRPSGSFARHLDLNACSEFMHLKITSPSLKTLTVHYEDYDCTVLDSMLEISAPNLQSLAILGLWYRKCRLMNLPCLVHATLAIQIVSSDEDRDNGYEWRNTFLRELLESLHHVQDFTIDTWCLQILSTWELKILPSPSSKRKCLILDTCLDKLDLPSVASLLKSSPDLETLVVNKTILPCYSPDLYGFDGQNYWKSSKPLSQCLLHNLKTVKMFDFVDGHHEMDLVQFLLKHAMVLEKMVIYSKRLTHLNWRKLFMPEELLQFTQKILSFPRASPHAVILFT
ncbi:hypothetical protein HHK36_023720 [Tetracentron sinense]|uniref:FBD domain-containing protein n=1 Tax=Tetracentron sinense TaxID=13715 RepID=A0A834YNQ0_TETSI|nr:hypothetical protein HHK36_023720 [Tetracentron sinense]